MIRKQSYSPNINNVIIKNENSFFKTINIVLYFNKYKLFYTKKETEEIFK